MSYRVTRTARDPVKGTKYRTLTRDVDDRWNQLVRCDCIIGLPGVRTWPSCETGSGLLILYSYHHQHPGPVLHVVINLSHPHHEHRHFMQERRPGIPFPVVLSICCCNLIQSAHLSCHALENDPLIRVEDKYRIQHEEAHSTRATPADPANLNLLSYEQKV